MDMENKINILMVCSLMSSFLSADYNGLKAYKQQIKMQPKVFLSTAHEGTHSYFVIDFKDINKMDTFALEKKYALKLSECIADGICIFKFLNAKTQQLLVKEILQKEPNIKSLKVYKPYRFKTF